MPSSAYFPSFHADLCLPATMDIVMIRIVAGPASPAAEGLPGGTVRCGFGQAASLPDEIGSGPVPSATRFRPRRFAT